MADLQQIKGIGPKTAQLLQAAGIHTVQDLAQSTPAQLEAAVNAPAWRQPDYAGWIAQARTLAGSAAKSEQRAELEALVTELNALAAELQALTPKYRPPAFTAAGLRELLKKNMHRFAPEMQVGVLKDLQEMLEQTPPEEFLNPETWKGMWYTLNYLAQQEAGSVRDRLSKHLGQLPGAGTLTDLKNLLADTPPEEFMKLDTWKGMWFILNYELQNQAQSLKKQLLGAEDEDE